MAHAPEREAPIEIEGLRDGELPALARFLARQNAEPECHVPYVGTGPAEIEKEILVLAPLGLGGFRVGRDHQRIVAAMGLEADAEVGRAWLRGPFAPREGWQKTGDLLLEAMLPLVPGGIGELELAGDERNHEIARFAERHGFTAFGHSHLMNMPRGRFTAGAERLAELPVALDDQVEALHDETWGRTYYTARQLRAMHGELKALLGVEEAGRLRGYVFVEVDPEVDHADIHFLVVHPEARDAGLGRRLLRGALGWIFSHREITRVSLTVRVDNPAAIGLYRAEGFETERVARGWRKQWHGLRAGYGETRNT